VSFDDSGAWGRISSFDAWGDVRTTFHPADLKKLHISYGDTFWAFFGGRRFHDQGRGFKLVYGANSFLSAGTA
jgi:hypothetical protein